MVHHICDNEAIFAAVGTEAELDQNKSKTIYKEQAQLGVPHSEIQVELN